MIVQITPDHASKPQLDLCVQRHPFTPYKYPVDYDPETSKK
jgi:hypothetical protein